MLCSNCGFENPTGHHFCGMCGTPLPQRPILAPGAQSTADLTRRPVEASQSVAPPSTNLSSSSTATEPLGTETQHSVPTGPNYFSQAEQAESLEQFIAGFRYAPPPEEEEVTMTGAKPELDEAATYEPQAPVSLSDEPSVSEAEPLPNVDAPSVSVADPVPNAEPLRPRLVERDAAPPAETIVEQPPLIAIEPPPFATKGMKDQDAERSRFLDLSEPTKEEVPTSTPTRIGGPSFLGLSDTPASMAYVADDSAERQSHWRVWSAIIVLGIFAVLGFLEWRAEKNQSSNGPIGIMKMQLDRLKGQKGAVITPPAPSQATSATAEPTPSSSPQGSGPQMSVAPQPKPQTATPSPSSNRETESAKQANPGAASNPATAIPTPKAQQSPTAPSGAANVAKPPETTQSANAKPATSSAKAETPSAEAEKPAKATSPGAEELAKAASASDAAAASAWLWKAVAKGNPEAPVKLANLYIKGDGVPQSCEQALVLLRSAAAKENAAALSRLGTLYATATCVPRNRVRAYQYMGEALTANPAAAWPRQFKEQLWAQMTPEERQRAQKAQ